MMEHFTGVFYLSGSSLSLNVEVDAFADGRISLETQGDRFSYIKGEYSVEPRLGSTKRVLQFKDGARLEVIHSDSFEQFERYVRSRRGLAIVDKLERRWLTAVSCLLVLGLVSFSFIYWGIPALAELAAGKLSQDTRRSISEQSLDTMTSMGQLRATRLDQEELIRSQRVFSAALARAGVEGSAYDYALYNYSMGGVENAFALPSGSIVATDSFVRLCETDEQMEAVFLHEIAHVEGQHGVRSVIQRAGVFVIASMALGDVSAVANAVGALPVLLLESKYSQRFELESDAFAAEILIREGRDLEPLKDILIALHKDTPDTPMSTFLSTHPSLRKRIESLDAIQSTKTVY